MIKRHLRPSFAGIILSTTSFATRIATHNGIASQMDLFNYGLDLYSMALQAYMFHQQNQICTQLPIAQQMIPIVRPNIRDRLQGQVLVSVASIFFDTIGLLLAMHQHYMTSDTTKDNTVTAKQKIVEEYGVVKKTVDLLVGNEDNNVLAYVVHVLVKMVHVIVQRVPKVILGKVLVIALNTLLIWQCLRRIKTLGQ